MSSFPLTDYLRTLLQEGRALVHPTLHRRRASEPDREAAMGVLSHAIENSQQGAPGTPPPARLEIALWAGETFAWATGLLFDRAIADVAPPEWITNDHIDPEIASHHWSADVVFCFTRGLIGQLDRLNDADPLRNTLSNLFSAWPLASVGWNEATDASLQVVLRDECLKQILVDRTVLHKDSRFAAVTELQDQLRQATFGMDQSWLVMTPDSNANSLPTID